MQSIIQPTQLTAVVRPARLISSVGASGDVRGPGSATDGQAALFDGPSGRRLRATATGAVGLALLARSALTAGALLLGAGAGAPTELATTSYGRSFLGLADAAAGRSLLQLGASDSPTFAGLTTTGQIACQGGLFRQSGGDGQVISVAASASYAAWLMAMTDRADYNGIQSVNSSYTARWGIGRFGESSGIAFYEGASRALWLTASAPGTAGAGEVRVGDGRINAAGKIATAQYFESAANSSGTPTAFNATNAEAGNYLTAAVNGSVASGVASWVKASLIESVGANAGEGSLVLGSYRGEITFQVGARTLNALTIAATGAATFGGSINAGVGGSSISLLPGSVDHAYMQFFPRTATPAVRGAYFGFPASGSANLQLACEIGYMSFLSSTAAGTPGANEVRIGAGQINAAGNITTAGYFAISGYVQPRSIASLVNIGASTYADIYTLVTNDLVQVTVGNATDGYAACAIITKASSGAPVIVRNDNSNANLTISVSGDAIRVTNGVGSTRTIIYCVTRLYG